MYRREYNRMMSPICVMIEELIEKLTVVITERPVLIIELKEASIRNTAIGEELDAGKHDLRAERKDVPVPRIQGIELEDGKTLVTR